LSKPDLLLLVSFILLEDVDVDVDVPICQY